MNLSIPDIRSTTTDLLPGIVQGNQFLLTISLGAMGLETNISKMLETGLKPLFLCAASWLFISGLSLGLITIFY